MYIMQCTGCADVRVPYRFSSFTARRHTRNTCAHRILLCLASAAQVTQKVVILPGWGCSAGAEPAYSRAAAVAACVGQVYVVGVAQKEPKQ